MVDASIPESEGADDALEHERIKLSFRAMGGGLWDYDVDADVLYCDERWHKILGLDPAVTPITSIEAFRPHIHPDDVAVATQVDLAGVRALFERDECYRVEFRIVRPDGAIRWLRSVACIVRDPATAHFRAIGCLTDISEFRVEGEPHHAGPRDFEPLTLGPRTDAEGADEAKPDAKPDANPLSAKERECLRWVSVGKTAWETAKILGVSPRTVEFHLYNATHKLDAGNKVQAAFIAVRRRLLDEA